MMDPTERKQDEADLALNRLFAAYREACPDVGGSANFVPSVWAAIEQSHPTSWVFPLRHWAQRLVIGTSLATAMLVTYLAVMQSTNTSVDVLEASYVDALTVESLDDLDVDFWHLAGNSR